MNDVIEVNGIKYRSENNKRNNCSGCAAENNRSLCRTLPSCILHFSTPITDIIFKRVEIHEVK